MVAGFWGKGPPLQVFYKGKGRPIHDGGGLCSPGRWAAEQRTFPTAASFARIRQHVFASFQTWMEAADAKQVFWQLAAGKATASPFSGEHVRRARASLDLALEAEGFEPSRLPNDRRTEVNFRRLAAMLEVAGDPDCRFLHEIAAVGARLGVGVNLPRVPAVFEAKAKWRLPYIEGEVVASFCDNYKSAEESMQDIKRQVREELERGAVVRMQRSTAIAKFGDRLSVASLGAVPKDPGSSNGVVRIIHDATHGVGINNRIKVRDRLRFPMIDDLDAALRQLRKEQDQDPGPRFAMKYDVAHAHKLVPIAEEDWPYQAFSLDDSEDIYMHTVGAFGFASAAYHWQRVAGAIVRLEHYLCGRGLALYHLLFADDGLLLARGEGFWRKQLFWLYVLDLLEVPLSWKKVVGGVKLVWIGYQLDVETFAKGLSDARVAWLVKWIDTRLRERRVTGQQMKSALGRMAFVAGALQHSRPFLGPVFAWVARLQAAKLVKLPAGICTLLRFFKHEVQRAPMTAPSPIPPLDTACDVFVQTQRQRATGSCLEGGRAMEAPRPNRQGGSASD